MQQADQYAPERAALEAGLRQAQAELHRAFVVQAVHRGILDTCTFLIPGSILVAVEILAEKNVGVHWTLVTLIYEAIAGAATMLLLRHVISALRPSVELGAAAEHAAKSKTVVRVLA